MEHLRSSSQKYPQWIVFEERKQVFQREVQALFAIAAKPAIYAMPRPAATIQSCALWVKRYIEREREGERDTHAQLPQR